MGSVFVSYRRSDSTPYAVSLATALRQALGSAKVFLDTSGMLIGEPFPDRLKDELKDARACIVVIGPDWLRAADKDGRRRIDDPEDWVHVETRFALDHKIAVPVLVHGASMPTSQSLPQPLKALADSSAASLDDDKLVQDLRLFVAELCRRFDLPLIKPDITWPEPNKEARALSKDELEAWVASRQSDPTESKEMRKRDWRVIPWIKDDAAEDGTALLRSYRFRSFEDAIHFMSTASRFITRREHHPAWENVWRTVTVRLTTFDIGHRPSVFDLRLAEYLDNLYREYKPNAPESPSQPSGPLDPLAPAPGR